MDSQTLKHDDRIARRNDPSGRKEEMVGVVWPLFVCSKCKHKRPIKGRKYAVKGTSRYGYICAECAA